MRPNSQVSEPPEPPDNTMTSTCPLKLLEAAIPVISLPAFSTLRSIQVKNWYYEVLVNLFSHANVILFTLFSQNCFLAN